MVADDFNGVVWRKKSGDDQQRDSTIEEAFANTNLPIPHGSSPLWGPGNVPGEWADVCGFIKPPNTDNEWQIRGHGEFEINRDPLTRAATTRFGSTFHTPTLDWSTNTVLATLSAASKTVGRARKEGIHKDYM